MTGESNSTIRTNNIPIKWPIINFRKWRHQMVTYESPVNLKEVVVPKSSDTDPVFLHDRVLVLNLNYVPINISTLRRSLILISKGKAEILECRSSAVHTVNDDVLAPSAIRLNYLVKRSYKTGPCKLSKKEVFLRDNYTCQYCLTKSNKMTIDHVIPRKYKGPNTWMNVVTACSPCNLKKAAKTPAEARMKLFREPKPPQPNPYRLLQNQILRDEWKQYIPWNC